MGITYEDLVAANLRAARARADLPLSTVAHRMQILGHTTWYDSKVSRAERGKTPVHTADLFALSLALETTVADLMGSGTSPDIVLAFPSGHEIGAVTLRNSVLGWRDHALVWGTDNQPTILRPANVYSARATDQSGPITNASPARLGRPAERGTDYLVSNPASITDTLGQYSHMRGESA